MDIESQSLVKKYEENLKIFRELIQAQDNVRLVWCNEKETEIELRLRHIDKLLTKVINHYGKKIGAVTNAS